MAKVYFTTKDGNRICGIHHEGTHPSLVILWHGFRSNKDSTTNRAIEPLLLGEGIGVLRADFYGHGESFGKFEDVTITEAVEDVCASVGWARKRGYKRIGLLGSSFGGLACLIAASKVSVEALGLRCPVIQKMGDTISDDPKQWKKKKFLDLEKIDGKGARLSYSFYEDAQQWDGFALARKVACPTLIIHGDADTIVPCEDSKHIAKLLQDSEIYIIKGADHRFSAHTEILLGKFIAFFHKHLNAQ